MRKAYLLVTCHDHTRYVVEFMNSSDQTRWIYHIRTDERIRHIGHPEALRMIPYGIPGKPASAPFENGTLRFIVHQARGVAKCEH